MTANIYCVRIMFWYYFKCSKSVNTLNSQNDLMIEVLVIPYLTGKEMERQRC